jgi:acetyltransferase-like isoleucine patch superfamily enzyme
MRSFILYVLKKIGILNFLHRKRYKKEMDNRREIFQRQYPGLTTNYFIHSTARLEQAELIEIGEGAEINDYVIVRTVSGKVKIGSYTQINPFTVIYGGKGVTIGNNVMIAPHCMIASGNHDFKQTSYPMRFAGTLSKGPIIIEDNVWIGANCTITDGVKIGAESVIAANSVVTKNVEPWSIVSGVPAVKIGSRLSGK